MATVRKKPGRKSTFNRRIAEKMLQLAKEGKTNVEIAKLIGVNPDTLYVWQGKHAGLAEALKAGKNVANQLVEAALFQRAMGYHHPDVKMFYDSDRGEVVKEEFTKVHPPDTAAAQFWLKNRSKDKWSDTQKVESKSTVTTVEETPEEKIARQERVKLKLQKMKALDG